MTVAISWAMEKFFCRISSILLVLAAFATVSTAAATVLAWNPSTSSNVTAYVISWGTNSQNYTQQTNVSGVTCTITSLTPGVTYYFAAQAQDSAGDTSSYSTELVWTAPSPAVITFGGLAQTYNGSPIAVTATTVPAGIATSITYNGSATAPVNAGSYTVVAASANTNYVGAATNTLTISQAPAGVTFANTAQAYSGSPEAVTVTTTPTGLATTTTYNGSTTAPQSIGSYTVVTTINDPNYTGSATTTLTISPVALVVTLTNLNQTFDGTPKVVTAQSTPSTALNITYNGSTIAPTNAGSYAVSATPVSTNFSGSATGTLVISQATATITLSGLSQSVTGSGITVTATTVPAGLATTISYNGSTTAPTNSGRYTVIGTVIAPNYTGSVTNTLVVKPASPTALRIVALNQDMPANAGVDPLTNLVEAGEAEYENLNLAAGDESNLQRSTGIATFSSKA